jgi:hypothetical protein
MRTVIAGVAAVLTGAALAVGAGWGFTAAAEPESLTATQLEWRIMEQDQADARASMTEHAEDLGRDPAEFIAEATEQWCHVLTPGKGQDPKAWRARALEANAGEPFGVSDAVKSAFWDRECR